MIYKLGRRPARHSLKTMRAAIALARLLDQLGAPPAASDDWSAPVQQLTGGNWGMEGNDQYGDCTCADESHLVMLRTANAGKMITPTAAQTLALYSAITGFNPDVPSSDQGADMETVCEFLEKTGYLGVKNAGHATIDPANIAHLKWAVQIFGGVKLGIQLPQSAMDQFNAGNEWDVVAGSPLIGGHDVPITHYDGSLYYIATWGKGVQPMTPAFLAAYCDEVKVTLSPEWISQSGTAPSKDTMAQLVAELAAIGEAA
ncbi:MAG TPA: hypothetical protein VMV27_04055 [Candidatus Binataceae bacterium]|nr:hypothetical protein [Candidatus Binataceae bacterium]